MSSLQASLRWLISLLSLFIILVTLHGGSADAAPTPSRDWTSHYPILSKRGCISSKGNWFCSQEVPSVPECRAMVNDWNKASNHDSLFYSGLGGGDNAYAMGKRWYDQHLPKPNRGLVMFYDVADPGWVAAQKVAILGGLGGIAGASRFLARLSQAFAETSTGTVYFLTPAGEPPHQRSAWAMWEYPALTRNPNVDRVVRVDPTDNSQQTIWTRGDPPTPNEPFG